MGTKITTQLARFVVEMRYPEIPKEVGKFTKGLAESHCRDGHWTRDAFLPRNSQSNQKSQVAPES